MSEAEVPVRLTLRERIEGRVARLLGRLPAPLQQRLAGEPPLVVEGQRLDPALQLVRALQRRRGARGYCRPDVHAARARLRREATVFADRTPRIGGVEALSIPTPHGALAARLYRPLPAGRAAPLTVYLHGGGFTVCDLDTHDAACRLLCEGSDGPVLSVAYRLAPEHPFPAALDDAHAAFRWAQANVATLGVDTRGVAIGGDSAGGNIAADVTRRARKEGHPPIAQLLVYPVVDSVTARPSQRLFAEGYFLDVQDRTDFQRHYLATAGAHARDPRVSPLLAGDMAGQPPALVVTAGFDILRDEGLAYVEALRAAGVPVRAHHFPALGHAFINMTGVVPAARRATLAFARDWGALLRDAAWRAGDAASPTGGA